MQIACIFHPEEYHKFPCLMMIIFAGGLLTLDTNTEITQPGPLTKWYFEIIVGIYMQPERLRSNIKVVLFLSSCSFPIIYKH